jgi:hypothetical protein
MSGKKTRYGPAEGHGGPLGEPRRHVVEVERAPGRTFHCSYRGAVMIRFSAAPAADAAKWLVKVGKALDHDTLVIVEDGHVTFEGQVGELARRPFEGYLR